VVWLFTPEDSYQILRRTPAEFEHGLHRRKGHMWSEEHVIASHECLRYMRLVRKHVKGRRGRPPRPERLQQGLGVDEASSSGVDQERSGAHGAQHRTVDDVAGRFVQGEVERDYVGHLEQFRNGDSGGVVSRRGVTVVSKDHAPERGHLPSCLRANVPGAPDTDDEIAESFAAKFALIAVRPGVPIL